MWAIVSKVMCLNWLELTVSTERPFYTLEQASSKEPKLVRDRGGCLSCHASMRTQNVPGFLVRSVYADGAGQRSWAVGLSPRTTQVTFAIAGAAGM